ncbi:heavy-metal-associated domain-containing protein [Kribbella shirazensis]|jgi:copper chaperone|uniref:Copper chaperone CopZ n=1 Tax=Kribbella shirazensis TaxID=1105143 RepID=A0A7X5V5M2_9ACTN|nr:heavy metal-associated domain-containing protein [Kribbella shirazensis]NIK55063.1 copper chaperone CopZ [Kribbella shirazensis]
MTTFQVRGMTCAHCAGFVTEELESLPGVESVAVDLPTGNVTLTADRPIRPAEIRNAVEAAGYELAET